ncbi:MAG: hypothetical protein JRJ12_11720 [Deltaproteobacteria bacterium]|nr:hypothetical protein [Deltaproteobacteria bacterium]
MHYVFGKGLTQAQESLLAARSLIYIKLLGKEELLPGDSIAPHAEEEVAVNRLVDSLKYEDCERLFPKIRLASREEALALLQPYSQ